MPTSRNVGIFVAVITFASVMRSHVAMALMRRSNACFRQCERFCPMTRAERRNSHRLHAERQAQ